MSSKGQNIIEINGKHYDALSGRLLKSSPENLRPKPKISTSAKSLDGLTKRSITVTQKTPTLNARSVTPAQKVHKKAQRAQTLVRATVKKPLTNELHETVPIVNKPVATQHTISPGRILRAGHIKKSRLISKFGASMPGSLQIKAVPLPVQPAPSEVPTLPINNLAHHVHDIAVPAGHGHFEAALASAVSHKQPKPKKNNKIHHRMARKLHVRPRAISVTASLTAALLIAGFIAYQNVPNLAMRLATTRSGVHGKLPDYTPAGFSISGPIEYRSGQITISFKSNTDDRQFKIVQESSNWNSDTLLASLANDGQQALSVQKQGKTIYIYDTDNATWVNGGTRYRIDSNADLNSDQLLRLAASL